MPVYVYCLVNDDGSEGATFEVEQPASDPALSKHPLTGQPIRRLITAPRVAFKHTSSMDKKTLDPKRTAKAGFTRYERDVSGTYHKISGQGPDTLRAD